MRYLVVLCFAIGMSTHAVAQSDSAALLLAELPAKYFATVEKKVDKYSNRITGKTEKTLQKLAKWESKVQRLLEKANPVTAAQLFGPGKITFASMLTKIKAGEQLIQDQKARYSQYRDKLVTSIKYIEKEKQLIDSGYIKKVQNIKTKAQSLEDDLAQTDAVEQLIKERKKQLIDASVKYIGKSKYLTKINKESYYYVESIRNYKKLFSDPAKTEEAALGLLKKIRGFDQFMKQNSMLASLFRGSGTNSSPEIAGLQSRAGINAMIEERLAIGGPNAREAFRERLKASQDEISKLKNKVQQAGGGSSDAQLPDFKPNSQKSKTFPQRLEFGSNLQFDRSTNMIPGSANIGLSLGYKLNDKSLIGLGVAYKLGIGSIQKIRFSHEGLGLRSFVDWKLKKQFFVSGGYELNYSAGITKSTTLKDINSFQPSGLIGLTKKTSIKSKWMKLSSFQLLFDFLAWNNELIKQPIIFRTGVSF